MILIMSIMGFMPSPKVVAWAPLRIATLILGACSSGRTWKEQHGSHSGHPGLEHEHHVDYLHDGHHHAPHDDHYDEHDLLKTHDELVRN
jgi:hypothetical protein